MQNIIAKLNNILGQNEPLEASKLPKLLGQAFMQIKEEEVKEQIPALGKVIYLPHISMIIIIIKTLQNA